jgi:UDP-N-acetylmuramyl pentapeptide phosphotransferase/UDP-N-acetylglucosamine-1-phosphate transferase
MGDVGSSTLGFLFSGISLATQKGPIVESNLVWLTILALWFFLSDGLFTIFRRGIKGEKIWQAHRSHLYQRLVKLGFSHSSVTRFIGFGGIIVAGMALWAYSTGKTETRWYATFVALLSFLVYWSIVVYFENQSGRKSGPELES